MTECLSNTGRQRSIKEYLGKVREKEGRRRQERVAGEEGIHSNEAEAVVPEVPNVECGRQIHSPLLGDPPTERWVPQLRRKVPTPGGTGVPEVEGRERLVAGSLEKRWRIREGQKRRYLEGKRLTEEGRLGRGSRREYIKGRKAEVKNNLAWMQFTPEVEYLKLTTIQEDLQGENEEEGRAKEAKAKMAKEWKAVWEKAAKGRQQEGNLTPIRKAMRKREGQVSKMKDYFKKLGEGGQEYRDQHQQTSREEKGRHRAGSKREEGKEKGRKQGRRMRKGRRQQQ